MFSVKWDMNLIQFLVNTLFVPDFILKVKKTVNQRSRKFVLM
jgi:hypothetical protein